MLRVISFAGLTSLLVLTCASAQDAKKDQAKKATALVEDIIKMTPEQFIKRFDKDGDGKLGKDELPAFLGKAFDAADKNNDAKLDRDEAAVMIAILRNFLANGGPKTPPGKSVEEIVNNLLKQFDTDSDGKISRKEAKGRIADIFEQLDLNKDGFLDRKELRSLAERIAANQKGGVPGKAGPAYDFDSLDKNADGRLSKNELKGTPYFDRFNEIDTDRSGSIDRTEFEAFLARDAAKGKK